MLLAALNLVECVAYIGAPTNGIQAVVDKNYVKAGDRHVIAFTTIIGGGETESVSFAPAKLKAGESYTFFCSFPGHSSIVKRMLQLGK